MPLSSPPLPADLAYTSVRNEFEDTQVMGYYGGAGADRRMLVGDIWHVAEYAGFLHAALEADSLLGYAFVQDGASGNVQINAKTGATLSFNNNAVLRAQVQALGLFVKAGNTTQAVAHVGGSIGGMFADVGNVTTAETDLWTQTLVSATLNANGYKLRGQFGGTFVGHATDTRKIKLYYNGSALFDSGAFVVTANAAWSLDFLLQRVSSTVLRWSAVLTTQNAPLAAYVQYGELTGTIFTGTRILKFTGTGVATNDIVAKMGTLEWVGFGV